MAITDFTFPGVTLTQIFEPTETTGTPTLGVLCIGRQFVDHATDVNALPVVISGGQTSSSIFTRQDTDIETPEVSTYTSAGVVVHDGVYQYTSRAGTSGGSIATATAGVDGAGSIVFTSAISDETGENTTFGYGAAANDMINVVTAGGTAVVTIYDIDETGTSAYGYVDSGAFPSGSVTSATFLRAVASYEQTGSGADYKIDSATRTVKVTPSKITIKNKDLLGGAATGSGALVDGTVYPIFREDVTGGSGSYVGYRGAVTSPAAAIQALGAPSDDNPLAAAVYCAASEAGGNTVFFTAVAADQPSEYVSALQKMEKYADIYSVVAAKKETDDNYVAVVKALDIEVKRESNDSESKVRRTQWFAINKGDETFGPAVKSKLIRDKQAFSIANERAQCVFADGAVLAGTDTLVPIGNYAVAAAAAGMRSYQPVQRPLSNLQFSSFTVTGTTLSRSLQADVASEGVWIVDNDSNNVPVTLRQVTTAASDNLNITEESMVSNADEVALALCHVGEDLVGCSNITPHLLATLANAIELQMNWRLLDHTGSVSIGPQLLEWELVSLEQDAVNQDHVNAVITCTPPRPFNRFNITLRVL